jgi:hypothetical protein
MITENQIHMERSVDRISRIGSRRYLLRQRMGRMLPEASPAYEGGGPAVILMHIESLYIGSASCKKFLFRSRSVGSQLHVAVFLIRCDPPVR